MAPDFQTSAGWLRTVPWYLFVISSFYNQVTTNTYQSQEHGPQGIQETVSIKN